jgi:hypothetical protein
MDQIECSASPPSRTWKQDQYRYEHIRNQVGLCPVENGLAQKQMLQRIVGLINDPAFKMSDDYEERVWRYLFDHVGMSAEDINRLLANYQHERQAELQRLQDLAVTKISRTAQEAAIRGTDSPTRPIDPADQLLVEFNSKYCVVNESGKALVLEVRDDPVLARKQMIYSRFPDFKNLYSNRKITVGAPPNARQLDAATFWLNHEERRQYIDGTVFDPSGRAISRDALNLWQGFAVAPRLGSWNLLKTHMLEVICSGNKELYFYLLYWAARMVQRPGEHGEVAIVLRGKEGVGKGIFVNALLHLLGQHGMHISNATHFTGQFNGHLRDCILLFVDEALFAGDRSHVSVLKTLVTEKTLPITYKFRDTMTARNYLHIIMASNSDWVVPAGLESRRFFVLDVPPTRMGDHRYFADIKSELENGGYEAMLYELLHRDLRRFNVRHFPVTEALIDQRKLSLQHHEQWWLDVLQRGYVYASKLGLEGYFGQWHDTVSTELLYASYLAYMAERRLSHPISRESLGRFLRKVAQQVRPSKGVVGEHLIDIGGYRRGALNEQANPYSYSLGDHATARKTFTEQMGIPVQSV